LQHELSRTLTDFVHDVRYERLGGDVVSMTKSLLLDWLGSGLAGAGAPPVKALRRFADIMGPASGPSQAFDSLSGTSPYFAAMLNAAASHVVEQDDVHNGSVFHPATVVFPPLVAISQSIPVDGRAFIVAAAAGYETGIRVGEYLGQGHYRVFHTTGTAGTLAAAMASGKLLGLDGETLSHALGSAGTQAAGLWEFLRTAAHSKQLHTAKAAADGMLAAYSASFGLTGARRILEGEQGMNAGMLGDGNAERLVEGLGEKYKLLETSFKFHASCRHTHPSADALLALVIEHDLKPEHIASIEAHVYQAAVDVLGPVTDPRTVHQAKFSMGFVLALIAARRSAGVADFTEAALGDPMVRRIHDKVRMVVDPGIDSAYPARWSARVIVTTTDGRRLSHKISVPKGDPGNTLTREELVDKFHRLASMHPQLDPGQRDRLVERVFALEELKDAGEALRIRRDAAAATA
jgi:2-methylcitrate dehydratase PrpD